MSVSVLVRGHVLVGRYKASLDIQRADGIVREGIGRRGLVEQDLRSRRKGDERKVRHA